MSRMVTKKAALTGYFLTYTGILVLMVVFDIMRGYPKEGWNITEFLINYQGGFVRRGLVGEVLLFLHNALGISPYGTIVLISLLAYGALIWFFVHSFVRRGYSLFILPFVFFLGNPVVGEFWLRKDVLILVLFIPIMYCALKPKRRYLAFVNLFFILALLIHESIGFFCFPILLLLLIARNGVCRHLKSSVIKSITLSVLQIAPSLATFGAVLYFKGSPAHARQIWDSWKPVVFPLQAADDTTIPAAIEGLSWSVQQGLSFSMETLHNFNGKMYAPLAWGIILVCIYYILTNVSKLNRTILHYTPHANFVKANLSNVLLFQLLSVTPLFVLGWDYGRWVFYWVASSFALMVLVPEQQLATLFPRFLTKASEKLNAVLTSAFGDAHVLVLCLIIGFPPFSWDLVSAVQASSWSIIVQFISRLFSALVSLVFG